MTVGKAIAEVDELWVNAYCTEQKITWLSRCESTIDKEIVQIYVGCHEPFRGFGHKTDREGVPVDINDERLIAGEPYDQLYIYWLEAMIHYADGEIQKYNNAIAQYQALFDAFRKWYGRNRRQRFGDRFRF